MLTQGLDSGGSLPFPYTLDPWGEAREVAEGRAGRLSSALLCGATPDGAWLTGPTAATAVRQPFQTPVPLLASCLLA